MNCCNTSKLSKYIWIVFGIIVLAGLLFSLVSCDQQKRIDQEKQSYALTHQGANNKTMNTEHIKYYTCGMHPSIRVSPEEYDKGKTNCPICNMRLTPVREEAVKEESKMRDKILFYRHPMKPSITSAEPAKDEMGMDFIPVYKETGGEASYYGCGMEGAEHVFIIKNVKKGMTCPICGMPLKKLTKSEADKLKGVVSRVSISEGSLRLAGVKTEPVRRLHLYREIRTVGRVAYDPNLAVAEEEFISALKAFDKISKSEIADIKKRAGNLIASSRRKLKLLGLNDGQIEDLEKTRQIHSNLILPEKKMWVYGEVYEYELSWIGMGEEVIVTTSSFPGKIFYGTISSINPVLNPKTRSVTFRAEIENPELKLKPEMYVDIIINSMYMSPEGEHEVLAIPKTAVLNTGLRNMVWVELKKGEYEGRDIDIGPEATTVIEGNKSNFYPVLKGLKEGELVVTKANFLIDSQSQISGTAATAYGGALGEEAQTTSPPVHQH